MDNVNWPILNPGTDSKVVWIDLLVRELRGLKNTVRSVCQLYSLHWLFCIRPGPE